MNEDKSTTAVEPSFQNYAKMYAEKTAEFVKAGSGIMSRLVKAREESTDANAQLKTLGLQFAVLGREFFTKHMTTPLWLGKTVDDFLKFTYGLKKEERFPADAWTNARLVLAVVVPEAGEPLLAEKNYFALTQAGLKRLAKIVLHEKVMKDGTPDRENVELKKAMEIAAEHGDGYMKALQAILNRLDGKETPDVALLADAVGDAINTIHNAIVKSGDGDTAKAKALYMAFCGLNSDWEQSGVTQDDQNKWLAEWVAFKAPKPEEAPTPSVPIEQPAELVPA